LPELINSDNKPENSPPTDRTSATKNDAESPDDIIATRDGSKAISAVAHDDVDEDDDMMDIEPIFSEGEYFDDPRELYKLENHLKRVLVSNWN